MISATTLEILAGADFYRRGVVRSFRPHKIMISAHRPTRPLAICIMLYRASPFRLGSQFISKKDNPHARTAKCDLIKKVYGAFGKGDIETIIDHLADQLVWRFDAPSVIPYAGEHDTRDQVRGGFFGALASTQKDYTLSTDEFIVQDDNVIMVGRYGATVTSTGKSFDLPLVHVWTVQNGKIKRFVNVTDTAKVSEAHTKD
jgi:ketosteroid isomerase-like protein